MRVQVKGKVRFDFPINGRRGTFWKEGAVPPFENYGYLFLSVKIP